jgi:GT2 family glycosyltransferase
VRRVAVSAIVVNHRREDLLSKCLTSLQAALAEVPGGGETIVVDNGSTDGSCDRVRREHPEATLIELRENRGFAPAVEEGRRHAGGEWLLLLNNDAEIEPGAAAELLRVGRSADDIGSVAAQLRFARRPPTINSAGLEIDRLGIAYDRLLGAPIGAAGHEPREVFGASAGAALYSSAMLDQIGGFDTTFFAFVEDADVAWRARMRGWRSMFAPTAIVHHHHSATAQHGSALKHYHVGRNRVRLLAKNADSGLLRRYGPAMVAYDLAYVLAHALIDRTLAPARGRLAGLCEWRRYRRTGADSRRPVELSPVRGLRAARAGRAAYLRDEFW